MQDQLVYAWAVSVRIYSSDTGCTHSFIQSSLTNGSHLAPELKRWITKHHIDPQQFGSLKGTSTTYCLLDILHNWLSSLDCPGKFVRVCFLDFSKAFNHIDHTILVTKLIHLGWLISWICSFLSGRRQAVKLLDSISEWMPVHAGVPQGTKLGPILFLIMINDLAIHSPLRSSHWKYVDDVTISEVTSLGEASSLQNGINCISQWPQQNNMNLNPKKCKIMTICPLKTKPSLSLQCSPLIIYL